MPREFKIFLHPRAAKELDSIPNDVKGRMKAVLKDLSLHPENGTPLNPSRYRRVRVGNYRAIYEIDTENGRIVVLFIGHRKNVYDDFSRLL
ncbi:MAG: type II toxin-antitoxin system RelE/ParE family toxin [Thermoplasmatales archaeon]|nr:type II toxin-antitoxin system RelE/ParE family toxin [Thermoplasmatales archaeon]